MFDECLRAFTEHPHPFAPVQLRFLLATTVERDRVQDHVLRLAVLSSLHFSDARFTEMLLDRLIFTIHTAGDEMRRLAMLCFLCYCQRVSCRLPSLKESMTPGSVQQAALEEEVSGPLKEEFVKLGTAMEEMWDLIMPLIPDMLHESGGKQ